MQRDDAPVMDWKDTRPESGSLHISAKISGRGNGGSIRQLAVAPASAR